MQINQAQGWLAQVYEPRSVAVVGASDDIRLPGGRLLQYLMSYGFAGQVYAVNPNREEVQGCRAYRSLLELPERVDLAVLLVSAQASVEVLQQCAQLKIPNALLGNSGFAEIGPEGAALQAQISQIAQAGGVRLIGPNTNGIINTTNGLTATFSPVLDQQGLILQDGPVAVVSQSGAVGAALFYDGQRSGLPVGRLFNSGNEIDITLEMVTDALLDPGSRITTVLCYAEGLRRPDLFIQAACKAQQTGKRIVLLKSGTTVAGAQAAAAHTASLSGEDRVYDGVMRQLGVVRARGYAHMLDVARVLVAYPQPFGPRASILSISGGVGIMLTDALEKAGMGLARFDEQVLAGIDTLLPPFLGRQNPLDVSGGPFHHLDRLRAMLQLFDRSPGSDFSIVAVGAFERRQMEIAQVLADEASRLQKPLFVLWFGGGDQATRYLNGMKVPCFLDADRLVHALPAGLRRRPVVTPPPDDFAADTATVQAIVAQARHAGRQVIDEVAGKRMLAAYGIDVVAEKVVASAEAVDSALTELRLPVVAKLRSDTLVHKARVGGVRLGLNGHDAVRNAVTDLLSLAHQLGLSAADVVLQEQVPTGVELLMGAKHDPTFGAVLTLGIGGVMAEAWDDVQIRRVEQPIDIEDMLDGLTHQGLLDGRQGQPVVEARVLAPTLARFVRLVRDLADQLEAIDVNPMIVHDSQRPPTVVDTVFFLKSKN